MTLQLLEGIECDLDMSILKHTFDSTWNLIEERTVYKMC